MFSKKIVYTIICKFRTELIDFLSCNFNSTGRETVIVFSSYYILSIIVVHWFALILLFMTKGIENKNKRKVD